MNTKKAHWIAKPTKIKTTLHSFSYASESKHSVFFILPENGEMKLTCRGNAQAAFVLMHTPDEFIVFRNDEAIIIFGGIKEHVPIVRDDTITLNKEREKLSFFSSGKLLLTIEKEAFAASSSFGVSSEGEGDVYIEVF